MRPASPPGPGILTVTINCARGLNVDETSELILFDEPDVRKRWLIYAILECGRAQVSSEALSYLCIKGRKGKITSVLWPRATNMSPAESSSTFKFDISAPSELTVYLFDRRFDSLTGYQVTSLGLIKLNPFLEACVPGKHWVDVQGGTGKVKLEVSYVKKKVPPLEDSKVWKVCREVRFGELLRVQKSDTDRTFAMRTIRTPDAVLGSETIDHFHPFLIEHPFIAPLEFIFKSPKGLSLLSPLASGGHLFLTFKERDDLELIGPEFTLRSSFAYWNTYTTGILFWPV